MNGLICAMMASISLTLSGCEFVPGVTKALDDYVTNEAVAVTVDKAAMRDETDIQIHVDIYGRD